MKKELNIGKILSDKPAGTKLFDKLRGEAVTLNRVYCDYEIGCIIYGSTKTTYRYTGKLYENKDAIQILVPSKEMQDWSKFAWKKGDVLYTGVDNLCIFDKWANDEYSEFYGRYSSQSYINGYNKLDTLCWTKADDDTTELFIKRIEEFHNGKLNLSTLQIEQPKQEFKDGDKKVLVDLPKKYEFKPFDKVLVRMRQNSVWRMAFFIEKNKDKSNVYYPYHAFNIEESINDYYAECIPYNEQTKHLLGTDDEWKG